MIRITVELVPLGIEAEKRTLAIAHIVNDGTGTHSSGNYDAQFEKVNCPGTAWKEVRINRFPRLRKSVWHLLNQALSEACRASDHETIA